MTPLLYKQMRFGSFCYPRKLLNSRDDCEESAFPRAVSRTFGMKIGIMYKGEAICKSVLPISWKKKKL